MITARRGRSKRRLNSNNEQNCLRFESSSFSDHCLIPLMLRRLENKFYVQVLRLRPIIGLFAALGQRLSSFPRWGSSKKRPMKRYSGWSF